MLKSAISLPSTSTILAVPAGMSSVWATFTNSGIRFSYRWSIASRAYQYPCFHDKWRSGLATLLTRQLSQKPPHRIVEVVNHALFQRNDRVVGDVNVFGTDFGAALGDVAEADSKFVLQQLTSIQAVEWVHFQTRDANKEAWAPELFLLIVIAQHVANVLAEEALDALAKLLHAIDLALIHLPVHVWLGCERRNLFVDAVIPGNVGDQILQHRKALHRLYRNRLIQRQSVQPSLASQARAAVDFRRARAALAGFAIPAH